MRALAILAAFVTAIAVRTASAAQPQRIVSLVPSVTETLFALGVGPEVVGVSQYCDYPKAATRLPKVGSFLTPNVEAIAGLRPTLVIGLEISANVRQIRALQSMGYDTLMVKEDTLEDIENAIATIGARLDRKHQADELLATIRSHIDSVRARLAGVPRRKVLMVVGHQPIVAVGRGTFLDELLKIAGADNIADTAGQSWPHLGIEYIIASAPEVILDGQMGTDPASPGGFWSHYPTIPAVREHRVFSYPQNIVLHPGPRVWQSLEILARRIHPEHFNIQVVSRREGTASEHRTGSETRNSAHAVRGSH
jgi:ABC-type Fe3+-hydroxamate transport system substrate-binding protein